MAAQVYLNGMIVLIPDTSAAGSRQSLSNFGSHPLPKIVEHFGCCVEASSCHSHLLYGHCEMGYATSVKEL